MKHLIYTIAIIMLVSFVFANEEQVKHGEVRLPLQHYNQLVDQTRIPIKKPKEAPSSYALGQASVSVSVLDQKETMSASVTISLTIEIFDTDWVKVPILPSGTPLRNAEVDDQSVQLIAGSTGFYWTVNKQGTYRMTLTYDLNALRFENGYSISIPLPQAAAITLNAVLPGTGLDIGIIPSAGIKIDQKDNQSSVQATIPTTNGVQMTWRVPHKETYSMSRAQYNGNLKKETMLFEGVLEVELFHNDSVQLELLPDTVTLNDIYVDGQKAPIAIKEHQFSTWVKGIGQHQLKIIFQVPVERPEGSPLVKLMIPQVPISNFALSLEGKKEIRVTPFTNVYHQVSNDITQASFYVPMTREVTLSWNEAVPEEIKTELRANASAFHLVYAEEGVLFIQAMIRYEITRGETNIFEIELPNGIQVNRIACLGGETADWRVIKGKPNEPDTMTIFINRKVKGEFGIDVFYDRSIVSENDQQPFTIPLVHVRSVDRQRGMVALLASKELTLKPVLEELLTRVGENQLPAFVRQNTNKVVAHTYKYVESKPKLTALARPPERKQGKFDAMVNTLISIGDVTMKGSATIDINIKSGTISDVTVMLPKNVNFLSLSSPSLRTHKLRSEDAAQSIDVQFTQEMDGMFRMDVAYERIMAENEADISVPTLRVQHAEVEQGRIAIEALSAVEIQPSLVEQLSSLDPNELPQQLVLKTTNPILLAYKYVHVDPPYQLKLKMTRHKAMDVQTATIDQATYHTLYTADGLSVTSASFIVRNSRQQFLRIFLPKDSQVWSLFVDGQPEKPAISTEQNEKANSFGSSILIKIINDSQGFPVNIIYQTPVQKTGMFGHITGMLPLPDMVVTHSKWHVYMPEELSYFKPKTNMKLVTANQLLSQQQMQESMANITTIKSQSPKTIPPLTIQVPVTGVCFVFEKLYANQSDDQATFSIGYLTKSLSLGGQFLALLSCILVWSGILIHLKLKQPWVKLLGPSLCAIGIIGLIFILGKLQIHYWPALVFSILLYGVTVSIFWKSRS
ncbi:MAG: hypothetical protein HQK77_01465 [Desulfobacterales bacterium]|nr:hypothetical protein [Desulfobacterales bacterium]